MTSGSPDIDPVVAFLREEWSKPFRITTVAQVMASLGIPDNVELRLRIGAYLADHLDLSERLSRWGADAFVLTEDEKLLARCIWQTWERSGAVPGLSELEQSCDLSPGAMPLGLEVLASLGFVAHEGQSYAMLADFEERAGGLGFNFHSVTLENGERFNVP